MRKIKEAPQAKISVIGTIFCTKNSAKKQKKLTTKITLPRRGWGGVGDDFGFNLGLQKIPSHRGDLPPTGGH